MSDLVEFKFGIDRLLFLGAFLLLAGSSWAGNGMVSHADALCLYKMC